MVLLVYLLGIPVAVGAAIWALLKRFCPWLLEDLTYIMTFVGILAPVRKMRAANSVVYDM